MGTRYKAPAGLDYDPITGRFESLSYGVIQAETGSGKSQTAEGALFRRLYPVMKPVDPSLPWIEPTCFKHEVLLPSYASDELWDAQRLVRTYDQQGFSLRDLMVIVTLRYPEAETAPQQMRLHEVWSHAYFFALSKIVHAFNVAAVCVMHVPSRAARPGAPHVHIMVPARVILPTGFGAFARPLATDEGRDIMDREWAAWRKETGLA